MLASEIVDPSEDRQVWVDFIFGRNVNEAVIFDVEVWSAEINFLARIHELGFDRRAQFFPPKIRSRKINFVPRPPWQARTLRLRNLRRRSFLSVQISVARVEHKIGDRLRAQFGFEPLGFSSAEVECLKKPVKPDHVREV